MNSLNNDGLSVLLSPLLLIPTLSIVVVAYTVRRFSTRISPTIPYVGEGSLSSRLQAPVEYSKDPVNFLNKARNKLGDVFCVDLFAVKIVYLLGVEGNRDILRASEDEISFWENARWAFGPVMDWSESTSISVYSVSYPHVFKSTVMDFPGWMSASVKVLRGSLQRLDRTASGSPICVKITQDFFNKSSDEDSIPLFKSISHLVLSYLLVLIMGEEFYRRHGEELIPLLSRFERELQSPVLRITPGAFWKLTTPGKFLFDVTERFDELTLAELKRIRENPDHHIDRDDYFYSLISQLGDQFAPVYGRHTLGVVFGGHANVAMSLPWLFLHARRVPGALERIRAESILPSNERRPYIDACFRETGRLYTNVAMMRMMKKTASVRGHVIPKGTLVACSPAATQRADANEVGGIGCTFTNAQHWDPERFLADPSAYAKWSQHAELVHFGLGLHACPGERLAKTMIYDFLLKVWMEDYELEVVSGLEEDVKGIDGVGAEGAWTEENMGTPSIRGSDIGVKVRRRSPPSF